MFCLLFRLILLVTSSESIQPDCTTVMSELGWHSVFWFFFGWVFTFYLARACEVSHKQRVS